MQQITVFHEDVFYAYFQPFRHSASHFDIWGGYGLETFGSDYQIVAHFAQNFVWTVVEGGEGSDQWITPGLHYVSRVCYLLTRVPHDWAPMEFRTEGKPRSITPRGLARRLTILRKIMGINQAQKAALSLDRDPQKPP